MRPPRSYPARDRAARWQRLLAWGVVGVAIAITGVLISVWGQGQSVLGDEWRYARWSEAGPVLDAALDPAPGKYALPVPLLLYERLFEWFGISSYLPYRLAALAALALVACLLFELVRRRLGYLAALPAAILVLFFGSGAEVAALSFRLPGQLSLIFGLSAFLALDRPGLRSDVAAAVLLCLSVASHPQGLAFVAGAAAWILLRPGAQRWRSTWVLATPAVLFITWLRPPHLPRASESLGERLVEAPGFALEGFVGVCSAVAGLVWPPTDAPGDFTPPLGWLVAAAILAAIALRLSRRRPLPPALVSASVTLAALLAAPTLAPGDRPPNLGRYLFPAGVLLLLVLAELARGARIPRGRAPLAVAVGAAAFALSLTANALQLEHKARRFASDADHVRAEAGALELARGHIRPSFTPEARELRPILGRKYRFPLSAKSYYDVARAYGTPAYTASELASQPPSVRRTARFVLCYGARRGERLPASRLTTSGGWEPGRLSRRGLGRKQGPPRTRPADLGAEGEKVRIWKPSNGSPCRRSRRWPSGAS